MIRVNKFELYREFVANVIVSSPPTPTITTNVLSNTFHYNFTFGLNIPNQSGSLIITNAQNLFTLNKTYCTFQVINYSTSPVFQYAYEYVNDTTIVTYCYNSYSPSSSTRNLFNEFIIDIKVYF